MIIGKRLTATVLMVAISSVICLAQEVSPEETLSSDEIIEIIAEEYAFQAPSEITSGWNTFRMKNDGEETHLLFFTRLPEGKTFDNYMGQVAVQFVDLMDGLKAGEFSQKEAPGIMARSIPQWFGDAVRMGGVGILEAGGSSQITMQLEPSNYFLECYMKTEEGDFHAMEGMARPLTVTPEPSGNTPPEADVEMILSNSGIAVMDEITPGQQTIAVHFEEHPEIGYMHDVNIVKLDGQTDLSEIVQWMNWINLDGLTTPAPAVFLGGAQEMPTGYTAYFTVDLEPGQYAWISELTSPQGLIKEFTVPDEKKY